MDKMFGVRVAAQDDGADPERATRDALVIVSRTSSIYRAHFGTYAIACTLLSSECRR